ncbi:MAG: hypothetical protein JWM51_270 [Microbacteriaceae bacterium]|nr:hypothetical protein [Microbacteriaceae bacterium]
MLTSASLLSLALVGQASGFTDAFPVCAITVLGVLGTVLGVLGTVGVLTEMRVFNAGMEDLSYVLAMNRLRGAYAEFDPGIDRYFMASTYDDQAGSQLTYYFMRGKPYFMPVVSAAIVGLFAASVTSVIVTGWGLPLGVGVVVGLADFAVVEELPRALPLAARVTSRAVPRRARGVPDTPRQCRWQLTYSNVCSNIRRCPRQRLSSPQPSRRAIRPSVHTSRLFPR